MRLLALLALSMLIAAPAWAGDWENTTVGTNSWKPLQAARGRMDNLGPTDMPISPTVLIAHNWIEYVEGTPDSQTALGFSAGFFGPEFKPLSQREAKGVSFPLAEEHPYVKVNTSISYEIRFEAFTRQHPMLPGENGLVVPGLVSSPAQETWDFMHEGQSLQREQRTAYKEKNHRLVVIESAIVIGGGSLPGF